MPYTDHHNGRRRALVALVFWVGAYLAGYYITVHVGESAGEVAFERSPIYVLPGWMPSILRMDVHPVANGLFSPIHFVDRRIRRSKWDLIPFPEIPDFEAREAANEAANAQRPAAGRTDLFLALLKATKLVPKEQGTEQGPLGTRRLVAGHTIPLEASGNSDAAESEAIVRWFCRSYGTDKESLGLRLNQVSGGSDSPSKTYFFEQYWHGYATDRTSRVNVHEGVIVELSVELYSFLPIGEPEPCISSADAIDAWKPESEGVALSPRVIYMDSAIDHGSKHGFSSHQKLLRPTWVLDDDSIAAVDAITGRRWMND